MELSLTMQCVYEFLGTFVMLLLGCGVVACTTLKKSKGEGGGWVVITIAWGLAVSVGVWIAGPFTGAHLNPAVSVGLAVANQFPWSSVLPYIAAQFLAGVCAGTLVYLFYKDHFDATEDKNTKLGVFCTIPAIENKPRNFLSEVVGTFVLMLVILFFGDSHNAPQMGLGTIGALPVGLLVVVIGMALGGTTGYAINPARDLGPRTAHCLLPIKGKRDSGWAYSWVPGIAPLIGAALAAGVYCVVCCALGAC